VRRVVVLGSGGSGKSTLARAISERTGLPVVHLDRLFWREGWMPAPREEALAALVAAVADDSWVLDGNFLDGPGGNEQSRFQRADTVVFLDRSRWTCLRHVLVRLVRDRGRTRPDLPDGCGEGLDLPFLRWVWRYPAVDRPRVLASLAQLDGVRVHQLRRGSDVTRFLDTLGGRR
jgi:adenylate kinase family enzyme